MAVTGAQVGWGILWFFVMILGAFPIANLVAWLYILLLAISVCAPPVEKACDVLLTVLSWPKICAQGMIEGRPMCGGKGT